LIVTENNDFLRGPPKSGTFHC